MDTFAHIRIRGATCAVRFHSPGGATLQRPSLISVTFNANHSLWRHTHTVLWPVQCSPVLDTNLLSNFTENTTVKEFRKLTDICFLWHSLHLVANLSPHMGVADTKFPIWREHFASKTFKGTLSKLVTSSSAMAERPRQLGYFKKARVNDGTDNDSLKDSH